MEFSISSIGFRWSPASNSFDVYVDRRMQKRLHPASISLNWSLFTMESRFILVCSFEACRATFYPVCFRTFSVDLRTLSFVLSPRKFAHFISWSRYHPFLRHRSGPRAVKKLPPSIFLFSVPAVPPRIETKRDIGR